jgi:hypothetical protein
MTSITTRPEVGMGITEIWYSDRRAGTIIEVSRSGKRAKFQYDRAIRIDKNGMSREQDYRYERDAQASIVSISLRKDGKWRVANGERRVVLGIRDQYHDYGF